MRKNQKIYWVILVTIILSVVPIFIYSNFATLVINAPYYEISWYAWYYPLPYFFIWWIPFSLISVIWLFFWIWTLPVFYPHRRIRYRNIFYWLWVCFLSFNLALTLGWLTYIFLSQFLWIIGMLLGFTIGIYVSSALLIYLYWKLSLIAVSIRDISTFALFGCIIFGIGSVLFWMPAFPWTWGTIPAIRMYGIIWWNLCMALVLAYFTLKKVKNDVGAKTISSKK